MEGGGGSMVTHHGSLLDAVPRLDDRLLLRGPAQEVGQLAVGAPHGVALRPLRTVAPFLLEDHTAETS